jgi:uncharacterized protein involved in outer membrane biogenesis
LRNADLSIYENQIEAFVSNRIGHRLTIDGRFELHFAGITQVVAEDITLSNPDWESDPVLIRVGHLLLEFDVWSLFGGPFIVETLQLEEISARLERSADRATNWRSAITSEQSESGVDFDTARIAFKVVRIDDVEFVYIDPLRPRPITILLDYLTVSPDVNGILDLDVRGVINELPLWADGKLGPWQNFVDGQDITADFDLTLGSVTVTLEGSVDDLARLEGVELNGVFSGPDIGRVLDKLGLPPFASGKFEVGADVRRFESGHQVRIDGNLGAIELFASGNTDSLLAAEKVRYDFSVSGPDARHVAELFGFDGVPGGAFQITGDYSRDARTLTFKDTLVRIGPNSVSLNGEVDISNRIPDGDVAILATGPDFSVFGPFISVSGLPEESFSIDGRIRKSGSTWEAHGVDVVVGEHRLSVDGLVEAGSSNTAKFGVRATGPDISVVQNFTDLKGVPARAYDVAATLRSDPAGIMIDSGVGMFGDNRIEVDGVVAVRAGMNGTTLNVRATGPELHNIAWLTGVPYLPDGPFEVSGHVRIDHGSLFIDNAIITVGAIRGSAFGRIGLGNEAGALDLNLRVQGPDVSQLAALDWLQKLAGVPFTIEGGMEASAADLTLSDTRLQIGEYLFTADGTISLQPMSNDSDLVFSASGPRLKDIGMVFGTDMLLARPFNVSGKFSGTPNGFAMRNFLLHVGDDDLHGSFDVDLREKPRLSGVLQSSFLDVSERLQQAAENKEQIANDESKDGGYFFSDEPLDVEWLQAADVDLELTVDRFKANTLEVADVQIGMLLQDGALSIDPIKLRDERGSIDGKLSLVPENDSYSMDASLTIDNVHIGLTASDDQNLTPPLFSGHMQLRGHGDSFHAIMASSNGKISIRHGAGKVKEIAGARIFGDMLLQVFRLLNPMPEADKYQTVDCGFYDTVIVDGIATIDRFAIQTDKMTIVASGKVELESEKVAITFRAKPREGVGISVGTIANSFLALGGTLRSPKLTIDPKSSVTTTGAAVATGGLSLLARGLWDRLSAQADICAQEKVDKED